MNKTNTLSLYCQFIGWDGGTIHQVKDDFLTLPQASKDTFCNRLMDNMTEISDIENLQWFMSARISHLDVVTSGGAS